MLKLGAGEGWLGPISSDDPDDPRPFLLPGVRVQFGPITIKGVRAARRAAAAAFGADREDIEEAGDALTRELLRRGILAWDGVGDAAGENLIPVSPEAVERFLDNPRAYEAADRAYVTPWANADAEGNVSAGSPNGTSAGATPATDTASSPATPSEPDAAPSAPTSSTSSKPKRPRRSGKS